MKNGSEPISSAAAAEASTAATETPSLVQPGTGEMRRYRPFVEGQALGGTRVRSGR